MFRTVPLSICRSVSLYTQQRYVSYRFADSLRGGSGRKSLLIPLASCMTYTIAVCTVKHSWWWTEELSKHVEFYSKNKLEKLVHLVLFIIKIYHDARSPERQICILTLRTQVVCNWKCITFSGEVWKVSDIVLEHTMYCIKRSGCIIQCFSKSGTRATGVAWMVVWWYIEKFSNYFFQ